MSSPSDPRQATVEQATRPPLQFRRVALAGAIGTFVEYYDYTAYGFLALTLAAVFFPTQDPTVALLSTLAVFAAAFVLRPLGGIVFGHLGDRYGRRPVLAWAVIGMATSSFLIGLLPSYATAGVWATVMLVALRGVQGLSAGGEIGGASTYVAEWSPSGRRAFWCSTINVGNLLGVLSASLLVAVLYATLTTDQMETWGWRIPFLLSLPLGLIGLYIRRRLEESPEFEDLKDRSRIPVERQKSPIATALRRDRAGIARAAGVVMGAFAGYYTVYVYGGTFLQRHGGLTAVEAAWCTSAALVLAAVSLLGWGALSDRIGRKPMLLGGSAAMALLAYPAFILMGTGNIGLAFLSQAALGLCVAAVMATVLAASTELFGTRTRFSGFALGNNMGGLLTGATAPYIATWLISSTGDPRSPGLFLVVAAVVSLITATTMTETAHRPLMKD